MKASATTAQLNSTQSPCLLLADAIRGTLAGPIATPAARLIAQEIDRNGELLDTAQKRRSAATASRGRVEDERSATRASTQRRHKF